MGFRNYDPAIGRFHSPDPLGELTPDWTPYRFAFNNPVFFNDPTGLCEDCDFINFYYDGWETPAAARLASAYRVAPRIGHVPNVWVMKNENYISLRINV
ncbi:MAG: hypothetical protein GX159_11315 [Flavobacteriaceae bacterium]|jgi:hypothetical protein|nr:hypothetical protein [Flavobacteriaceae bacterium]